MIELTPCPFCGSEAYAYEIPPHKHVIPMGIPDYGGGAFVECTKCTAAVSGTDLENALKAWNGRIEPKPQWVPVTERLPKLQSENRCHVMVNTCNKGDKRSGPMFYERAVVGGKTVERWLYCWGGIADKEPDYWMPLPEPYTPAGEEENT